MGDEGPGWDVDDEDLELPDLVSYSSMIRQKSLGSGFRLPKAR